jgi:hypothetical protein
MRPVPAVVADTAPIEPIPNVPVGRILGLLGMLEDNNEINRRSCSKCSWHGAAALPTRSCKNATSCTRVRPPPFSELRMKAEPKHRYWPAVAIVGRVVDELVVERQPHAAGKRKTVIRFHQAL